MTPQGKPIKASCNDTVAAGAWAFESTETWEGREWCYKGRKFELAIKTGSSHPCSPAFLPSTPLIPGLLRWEHQSLRAALQFHRPRNSNMSLHPVPLRLLDTLHYRKVSKKQARWVGAWHQAVYSGRHGFSPKGKRLAQREKMKLRENKRHILMAHSVQNQTGIQLSCLDSWGDLSESLFPGKQNYLRGICKG